MELCGGQGLRGMKKQGEGNEGATSQGNQRGEMERGVVRNGASVEQCGNGSVRFWHSFVFLGGSGRRQVRVPEQEHAESALGLGAAGDTDRAASAAVRCRRRARRETMQRLGPARLALRAGGIHKNTIAKILATRCMHSNFWKASGQDHGQRFSDITTLAKDQLLALPGHTDQRDITALPFAQAAFS